MIGRVYIENFLFIRDLEIEFKKGLNVITGETGTGKSMTLSAIEFVLGKQGNYSDDTAVEIEIINEDEEIILRREIRKGRSRYFLNGRGTHKSVIKEILGSKVSFQGQNEFVNLIKEDFQRKVIDTFANLSEELRRLGEIFTEWKSKEKELLELKKKREEILQKRDYLEFRVKELEEVGISLEEYEELKKVAEDITNLEKIKRNLYEIYGLLMHNEGSVYENLGIISKNLSRIANFSNKYKEALEKVNLLKEEIYDIYNTLRQEEPNITEEEINEINEKLYMIQRLEEKYKRSYPEILKEVQEFKKELEENLKFEFYEDKLESEVKELKEKYFTLAKKISLKRKEKSKDLEERISNILKELNLERAQLKVHLERGEPTRFGVDRVKFMFSSYGKDFRPLNEVVSGGELSRLFLALSIILPASETYIFDEVDIGISGETSLRVAKFLKELAKRMQVIVITHSATLCAAGDYNFKTEKKFIDGKPYIEVKELSPKEKLEEVARLMGLKSQKTLEGARELLEFFRKAEAV